eukprot:993094-Alexandrium_andersonii.AAC.1
MQSRKTPCSLVFSTSHFRGRRREARRSYDDDGEPRDILQGEGGEQGDPLMPALHAPGQHSALVEAKAQLPDGELLFAFLDD